LLRPGGWRGHRLRAARLRIVRDAPHRWSTPADTAIVTVATRFRCARSHLDRPGQRVSRLPRFMRLERKGESRLRRDEAAIVPMPGRHSVSLSFQLPIAVLLTSLVTCTPSRTAEAPAPSVSVPAAGQTSSQPERAADDSGRTSSRATGAESAERTEPGTSSDCTKCEDCSGAARFQLEDGTEHTCCRWVGPVNCGSEPDGAEGYCVMAEPCPPSCCK
jgi:hypothetical protein